MHEALERHEAEPSTTPTAITEQSKTDTSEPSHLAEKRAEGDDLFRKVFQCSAASMDVITFDEGRFMEVNQRYLDMFGYRREEVIGKTAFELGLWVDPEDRERLKAQLEKTGHLSAFEAKLRTKPGEVVDAIVHGELVELDGERCILCVAENITERKRTEAALRLHSKIVENMDEGVMLARTGTGEIVYTNATYDRMFGYGVGELAGQHISVLYPPRVRNEPNTAYELLSCVEDKGRWSGEIHNVKKDGSSFWTYANVVTLDHAADGGIWLSVQRDITKWKLVLRSVRENEQRFRQLFESSPDAVFVDDLNGNVLDVNPAACRLHGLTRDDLIGQSMDELVPMGQRTNLMRDLQQLVDGRRSQLEGYIFTKDRCTVPVEIRGAYIRYDGQPSLLLHVRDVTERKRLQEQVLNISEEQKRKIGRNLHDGLGSHFTGLQMLCEGLAKDAIEGQKVDVETLQVVAKLARKGVEQARALARGLNPVKLEAQGLHAALQELTNDVATYSGLRCHFRGDDSLSDWGSKASIQIYWIAQEAMNNAVKHAQATCIEVLLFAEGDAVRLTVRDDGVGIPEFDDLTKGMGLRIMAYRAHLLGASFQIENALGGGTEVSCSMPFHHLSPTISAKNQTRSGHVQSICG